MLKVGSAFLLLTVVTCQDTQREAVEYLANYGYIATNGDQTRPYVDATALEEAVMDFQKFAGLVPTGELDRDTIDMMKTRRCGKEDKVSNYVIQGSKWPKKSITYSILSYPTNRGISRNDVKQKIRQAFDMWEKASPLRFQETSSGSADIKIKFAKYDHGDKNPFDGEGGVLAHAYYPRFGGDAHFDDSEQWSVIPNNGIQVLNTLTHEFGHSLGLSHSRVPGSIMAPFYKGWDTKLQLNQDDKKGIQALYGPPQDRPTVTKRPVTKDSELCGARLDAAVQTYDGSSYVFSGDKYWKLTSDSIAAGFPRKISSDWPGLPDNIDAAVTWRTHKVTYFFKGSQYWRFKDRSPSPGYPKNIMSSWSGLPANIDAAFSWGRNKDLYFFQGSQYWKYNTRMEKVEPGYPKSISLWKDVPQGIEAALSLNNGKSYIFKDGNYWRLDGDRKAVARSDLPFPRNAGQWWFGCPKKTNSIPLTDGK